MTELRTLLGQPAPLVAPGCFDALSAALVEQAGFAAGYVSGASIAYTRLGRPDLGLVSMAEVADTVARMRERVAMPLIVDIDNGYGNALNVQRTVTVLERAGASAVQIEDQQAPKRCGHLKGKAVIGTAEMVGKIRAALDVRNRTLVVARTDAIAVEGFAAAIERAEAYVEAGADILFVEAPETEAQMREIVARFAGRIPLLANMVEGGATPFRSAADLGAAGFSIVIFPGSIVRALVPAVMEMLARLKADGSTAACRDRMLDISGLNRVLGTEQILADARQYDDIPGWGIAGRDVA